MSKVNPQRENGNRQIANDVYDALIKAKLSGAEYQIVLFIIGKIWGFRKPSDKIAYSQMVKATNLTRRGIIGTVQKLEKKRIVVVDRKVVNGGSPVNKYLFNKHYDTWLKESGEPQFTTLKVVNHNSLVNKNSLLNAKINTGQQQYESGEQGFTGEQTGKKVVNASSPTKETIQKKTTTDTKTVSGVKVKNLTTIQKVIEAYKNIKGFGKIPNWDKVHFARFVKDAQRLLLLAENNVDSINKGIEVIGEQLDSEDLKWNLSTIVRLFPEYLVGKQPEKVQWT